MQYLRNMESLVVVRVEHLIVYQPCMDVMRVLVMTQLFAVDCTSIYTQYNVYCMVCVFIALGFTHIIGS